MRHAARQLPSWLIFDVSQLKLMRTASILIVSFFHGLLCAAPTPNQNELARDVVRAMGIENIVGMMLPQIQQSTSQLIKNAEKQYGFSKEEAERFARIEDKVIAIAIDSLRDIHVALERVYAQMFTEKELLAMKAYYSSPEGRSILKKSPEVTRRITPLTQDASSSALPYIMREVQREIDSILASRKK